MTMPRGARYSVIFLFALSILIASVSLWWTSRLVNAQAAATRTLCAEQRDVAAAPVTANSSKFGVQLIADFRAAYAGLRCQPPLPPPSPLLRKLAAKYGVHVMR